MWLRAYVVFSSLMLVVLTTAAFQQRPAPAQAEITVERINIVDQNGTLRMVISNKDRMHPGVMDGKVINRPRPYAGVIFFNDEGDEVGGVTYAGQVSGSLRTASAGLTFDQLKQDQTIGLHYGEENGQRSAALEIWDRSDTPLSTLIDQLNNANSIQDAAAREAAVARARAAAPPAPRRLFVGKTLDRAAEVSLADGSGQARLNLKVDANGNPRIEFLDAQGKVVS
ncbi:MAG TPA: hypothetical protein VF219_00950, partial [Vicinamibacterales bacterium]